MLTFEAESHAYHWNGRPVPSVTSILRPVSPDFSMINQEVLERARQLGIAVHKTIELYENDDLVMDSLDPQLAKYLADWIDIRAKLGIVSVQCEKRVYSERWGYAGTLDIEATFNTGEVGIIDLKRTAAVPKSVGPQTAAYAEAAGNRAARRGAIHLTPTGAKYVPLTSPIDWAVFTACLTVHRFNQGH